MIVELAERDPALFRKLEIASAADRADDKTLAARLGKAIDQATATRGYVEYGEAGGWAAGVDEALDALEALDAKRDRLVLKLAEHAIDRIESAIESIDNSNGQCGDLLERARDIHIRAARSARPNPIALARDLFERETGDGYGTFDGAAWLYAGRSARPDGPNIAGSRPKHGRSCRRSARAAERKPKATMRASREFSTGSPRATTTSRRASRCAPRTCRRRGSTLSSPSSASSTKARTRRCAGPRKAYGHSRMALPTRASCSSPPTFL